MERQICFYARGRSPRHGTIEPAPSRLAEPAFSSSRVCDCVLHGNPFWLWTSSVSAAAFSRLGFGRDCSCHPFGDSWIWPISTLVSLDDRGGGSDSFGFALG